MAGKRLERREKSRHSLLPVLAVLAGAVLIAAGVLLTSGGHSEKEPPLPAEETPQEAPPADAGEPEPPAEEPVLEKAPWAPVPESEPVDDSYFDSVIFVGDSRTDGFRLYSGLERGTYFCVTGETVAIINPPESAILAVGKIAKTPVVVTNSEGEDEIVIKSMCALCLSYDHRIIDGAEAAKFLQKVKQYLQNPVLLI